METNFKYKVGDIVKISSDWWSTCPRPNTYICVIVGQRLLDGKIVHGGIEGQKYGYYNAQYTFDGFDHIAQKSVNEDIELLSEYWYINDSFEICKETNVELNSQFIHRAYGFGVFLTREDASRAINDRKYARYSNMNNLFKIQKQLNTL